MSFLFPDAVDMLYDIVHSVGQINRNSCLKCSIEALGAPPFHNNPYLAPLWCP